MLSNLFSCVLWNKGVNERIGTEINTNIESPLKWAIIPIEIILTYDAWKVPLAGISAESEVTACS